jgi:two-component system phosphate regulon sensor histidine kinase PhoR
MPPAAGIAWYIASRIAVTVAIGALVGLIFGSAAWGVGVALCAYVAWQLWMLASLDGWLKFRRSADPPDVSGMWGDVVTQVVRLHRRKRFHKDRLTRVLRELRRSTAALADGVVILNGDNEIVWLNPKASELLGLAHKADRGIRIDNLVRHPEFVRHVQAGQYSVPVTVRPDVTRDQYLELQIVPYGESQRMLLVRDVSKQMRLEAMRKDFVANASHELRSPLTVIAGYLETLASDPALSREVGEPLEEMRRQSSRMAQIVEDLLALSRLEAGEGEVQGTLVDTAGMLALIRKDILARPTHPKTIEVRIDSAQRLVGDESMLQSAFFNLLDNAAKYTPADGSVTARWWTDSAGGHLSVTDTGPGIPAEHLPRITERFYRVDPGRGRDTGGSGLGLAIVKHVLQRHGGELEIASADGKGSTFTCHFPARRLREAETQVASA